MKQKNNHSDVKQQHHKAPRKLHNKHEETLKDLTIRRKQTAIDVRDVVSVVLFVLRCASPELVVWSPRAMQHNATKCVCLCDYESISPWKTVFHWIVLMLISFSLSFVFFFFNDTATTEIYTLSLHDALPI